MIHYYGEPVYRVRVEDVENVTISEEENQWVYRREEDGMLVFWNLVIDMEIYIEPNVFEYCFEVISNDSDEEDIT